MGTDRGTFRARCPLAAASIKLFEHRRIGERSRVNVTDALSSHSDLLSQQSLGEIPKGRKCHPTRPSLFIILQLLGSDLSRSALLQQFSLLKSLYSIKLADQSGYRGPILETNSRTTTLAVSPLRVKRPLRNKGFDTHNSRLPCSPEPPSLLGRRQ